MALNRKLLLLDLDGVVVYEIAPPHVQKLEILRLHEFLAGALRDLRIPVVVLTHRSRAEAAVILRSAGLTDSELAGVLTAQDILRAALGSGQPWMLLRWGLRKSWVLPIIERRYGVRRENIAFIDDRRDNLEDMLARGIGLALHAPSAVAKDGSSLTSFDFQHVAALLQDWDGRAPLRGIVPVRPCEIVIEPWRRTGLSTRRQASGLFNGARRYGRAMRRLIHAR